MATKKRKSVKRLSAPALLSARRKKSTRRRKRSLRDNIPGIGAMSIHNPLIGGMIGATLGMFLKNQVPDDIFKSESADEDSLQNKIQPYIKGGIIALAGILAKNYKQPEIAGGLFAVATVLTIQKLDIPGLASGGMRSARFVDPRLLRENVYPSYGMNEPALLSGRY